MVVKYIKSFNQDGGCVVLEDLLVAETVVSMLDSSGIVESLKTSSVVSISTTICSGANSSDKSI